MTLKTYGIDNLVDWKAQINVGKAKVIVHFSGGAITRYGVTPAEYSTADPMMQHVIEKSDYYKKGRIKLIRTTEVADDSAEKARKAREAKRAMTQVAEEAEIVEEQPETLEEEEAPAEAGEAEEVKETALKEVEITCLQDALDYLKDNFNVATSSVRSYEKAQETAALYGIVFKGGKL